MLERIKDFLYILMGSTFGTYLGTSLWRYLDYRDKPGLYAMMSAPWYTPLLSGALLAAALLLVELFALLLVKRKIKQSKK